jgi:hypothetical protein
LQRVGLFRDAIELEALAQRQDWRRYRFVRRASQPMKAIAWTHKRASPKRASTGCPMFDFEGKADILFAPQNVR